MKMVRVNRHRDQEEVDTFMFAGYDTNAVGQYVFLYVSKHKLILQH